MTRYPREGRSMTTMELPEELVQVAKEQDEPLWKVTSEALSLHLGMDEVSSEATHRRRLQSLREQESRLMEERDEIEEELHNTREKIEFHEEELHKIQQEKDSYEERLDQLLREMDATDKRVLAFKSSIRELAIDKHGQPTPANRDAVVKDLRERSESLDVDISEMQWNDGLKGQQTAAADGGDDDIPESLRKLAEQPDEEVGADD